MTSPAFKLLAPKNNATTARLLGSIGGADTAVALQTDGGATLPSISRGTATSTGDGRTLNDTGDLGGLAVGEYVYNLTDESWCVVISIADAPNTVRTTPLEGGSDNIWTSGDVWVKGLFVATITQFDEDGEIVKQERVLVTNRSGDNLTVVRGFGGDITQSFDDGDYVQILVEEDQIENLHQAIRNVLGKIDAIHRGVPFFAETTGSSDDYEADLPGIVSYDDIIGVGLVFLASFGCTGPTTMDINGLGAVDIKKWVDGSLVDTDDADIPEDAIMILRFDGTDFQLTAVPNKASTTSGSGRFGDGSDGSYNLNGTQPTVSGLFTRVDGTHYRLDRCAFFNNLTISNGIELNPNGFIPFIKGTLTNGGGTNVASNGGNGGNGVGVTGSGTGGAGGTAGAAAHTGGVMKNSLAGVTGGAGGNASAGSGSAGSNGNAEGAGVGATGAGGGIGGTPGGGGNGAAGNGATATAPTTANIIDNNLLLAAGLTNTHAIGGNGGGGGGGGAKAGGVDGGGGGGGSGANGGNMLIYAYTIVGTGNIRANGGNGGNGGSGTVGGGGGAGGSGGYLVLFVGDTSGWSGNAAATGGTGGTAGTGQSGMANGNNGTAGVVVTYTMR